MLVWVTWYSQWQNHNRMAKLPCLVSSVILNVYIPERYSVYKCVTCLHGTTFLAFKNTMCCHGITYRLYIDIMPLPSLLCHSRIPPSVEYRYIGQANTEVCQYILTYLIQLQQVNPVSIMCCHVSQSLH